MDGCFLLLLSSCPMLNRSQTVCSFCSVNWNKNHNAAVRALWIPMRIPKYFCTETLRSTPKRHICSTAIAHSKSFSSQNTRAALKSRNDAKRSNISPNQGTVIVIKVLCIRKSENQFLLRMHFSFVKRSVLLLICTLRLY